MAYVIANRTIRLGEKLQRIPWTVVLLATLLAAIGTAGLYSVSSGSFQPWAERHVMRYLLCLALVLTIALTSPRIWMPLAYPAYVIALFALFLVPFFGVDALGARRWLSTGFFSFQPAEFMKLTLVLALARYYHELDPKQISQPAKIAIPILLIFIPVFLTLRQPDLGSAVLFAVTGLAIMFLAGVSYWYFVGGAIVTFSAMPLIWAGLHGYQRRRIEVFLEPDRDPLGAGYHITQSKIALGSGGVSGRGFMQGTQSQLDFLPEKHTDFMFTMLGEEWGFIGGLLVIALFCLLVATLAVMALRCRPLFGRLVIAGSALTIFIYFFINIAMVTGLVPVVGVPLPLVSYGGTSMVTIMTGLGFAFSCYVHSGERLPGSGGGWHAGPQVSG